MKRDRKKRTSERCLGEVDNLLVRLKRLGDNETVILKMIVPASGRVRKSSTRFITIVPGPLLGMPRGVAQVAVLGHGATIIDPSNIKHRGRLILAGIPGTLAKALMDRMVIVFMESFNGNRTNFTTHPGASRRSSRRTSSNLSVSRSRRASTDAGGAGTRRGAARGG